MEGLYTRAVITAVKYDINPKASGTRIIGVITILIAIYCAWLTFVSLRKNAGDGRIRAQADTSIVIFMAFIPLVLAVGGAAVALGFGQAIIDFVLSLVTSD